MTSRQSGRARSDVCSRILHPRELADGAHEVRPLAPLRAELSLALGGDVIVAAPALPGLLHPAPLDPGVALQAVEQRVERRRVDVDDAARLRVEELAQLVAV